MLDIFPPVFSNENRGAFQNPFSLDVVITNQDTESEKYSKIFSILQETLSGRKRTTAASEDKWYRIPQKEKLGLLDYCITVPLEAITVGLVSTAFIVGVLTPVILMVLLIVAILYDTAKNDRRNGGSFSSGFFDGFVLANVFNSFSGNKQTRDSAGEGLVMGVAFSAIAFAILYPIRLAIIRGVVPLLSNLAASVIAPVAYLAHKPIAMIMDLYGSSHRPNGGSNNLPYVAATTHHRVSCDVRQIV
ncbi:MAG: hypothetical protein A3F43_02815 [Gammaproteobacteria bacterium RIFCSPHIGHO2_12_FULL_42_10]|nr:MAG: hypothetical protein A3F43_02815 [Gammaproteobacteria bacterium RIFCSPHIGHO2_12_FULL_42_10]